MVLPTPSWLLDGLGPEAHETYILEGPCSRSAGGLGSNIGGPNEPIYDKISVKKNHPVIIPGVLTHKRTELPLDMLVICISGHRSQH